MRCRRVVRIPSESPGSLQAAGEGQKRLQVGVVASLVQGPTTGAMDEEQHEGDQEIDETVVGYHLR